ncbi:MAG: chemotaxis protein CheW [Sandaracinaceae bacterium]
MKSTESGARYVVFRIARGLYAIEERYVVEMQGLSELAPHPHGSAAVRGVARVRGRLVPVVDVRFRMGLPPRAARIQEQHDSLRREREAHQKWVASVVESPEAELPSHASCGLREWVRSHLGGSEDLASLVERFETADTELHDALAAARSQALSGASHAAGELIEEVKEGPVVALEHILSRVEASIHGGAREIVLYVDVNGVWRGLVVDAVEAVTVLAPGTQQDFDEGGGFVTAMASASGFKDGVFVLDLEGLLRGRSVPQPQAQSEGAGACSIAS